MPGAPAVRGLGEVSLGTSGEATAGPVGKRMAGVCPSLYHAVLATHTVSSGMDCEPGVAYFHSPGENSAQWLPMEQSWAFRGPGKALSLPCFSHEPRSAGAHTQTGFSC